MRCGFGWSLIGGWKGDVDEEEEEEGIFDPLLMSSFLRGRPDNGTSVWLGVVFILACCGGAVGTVG